MTLNWLPTGVGMERFRMLKLSQALAQEQRAACIARIGGANPDERNE